MMVAARPARAEHEGEYDFPTSASAGPTVGISWGRGVKAHPIFGFEAGIGFHPLLYGNAGVTYRNHELFSYAELDGWYLIGATVGFGYGTWSEWQAVAGVWEPLPVVDNGPCSRKEMVVVSFGYRWTGLHEVYAAGKYGEYEGFCIDL
jgi:hypothetical protein